MLARHFALSRPRYVHTSCRGRDLLHLYNCGVCIHYHTRVHPQIRRMPCVGHVNMCHTQQHQVPSPVLYHSAVHRVFVTRQPEFFQAHYQITVPQQDKLSIDTYQITLVAACKRALPPVQTRLNFSGNPPWSRVLLEHPNQACMQATQHHTAQTLLTGLCGSATGAVLHNSCAAGLQASVNLPIMEFPTLHSSCDQQSTTADWRQAGQMALANTLATSIRLSDHRPHQRFHPYSTPAPKQLRSTVPDHCPIHSIQRDQCCIPTIAFRASAAHTKPPAAARLHATNRQLPPCPSSQSGTAHTCRQHSIPHEINARPFTTAHHHLLHATQCQSPTQATICNSKGNECIPTLITPPHKNTSARCPQGCASGVIIQCPEAAAKTQVHQHTSCQQASSTNPSSPAPYCAYSSIESSSERSIHISLSTTTTTANSCHP